MADAAATHAPRLMAELEAVLDPAAFRNTAWVVSRLAANHPQAGMRPVFGALIEVLQAMQERLVPGSAGGPDMEEAVETLFGALGDLPDGYGPRLLEWPPDHPVTRMLKGAWRDFCHRAYRAYEEPGDEAPAGPVPDDVAQLLRSSDRGTPQGS